MEASLERLVSIYGINEWNFMRRVRRFHVNKKEEEPRPLAMTMELRVADFVGGRAGAVRRGFVVHTTRAV